MIGFSRIRTSNAPALSGAFPLEFHIILAGWEQLGSIGIEERWAEFHVIDFTTLTLFHLDLKMGGGSIW